MFCHWILIYIFVGLCIFSFFFFFSCSIFSASRDRKVHAKRRHDERAAIGAYLRVSWLGQRKRVSVTRELERNACTRTEYARSRASGTETAREGDRVAFHVIERRARLERRVTRSTTLLPLPTRARNVSDRALGRTESWLCTWCA